MLIGNTEQHGSCTEDNIVIRRQCAARCGAPTFASARPAVSRTAAIADLACCARHVACWLPAVHAVATCAARPSALSLAATAVCTILAGAALWPGC